MSVQRNIDLIYQILADLDRKPGGHNEQLVYDLGYLIGLLARIANTDSGVYQELKNIRARQLKHKK
jgi:hypothetical protein